MTPSGSFAARLIAWQRRHGRHELPWQGTRDPYRIWLAEIMLQQTQVRTVIPYYGRFLARFPDLVSLAAASLDQVLQLWSGLGYYSRARNLHAAALAVIKRHGGRFPSSRQALASLPGVGRSTAAAIAVFAWGAREAILDGNVRRVLARSFAVEGRPGSSEAQQRLWALAEALLPRTHIQRYTQALMDLGSMICTRTLPRCAKCPLAGMCEAERLGKPTAFPARRARGKLPQRQTLMLLALSDDRVLLEKRPPTGVWGGLWSLPEFASERHAVRVCRERFGFTAERRRRLEPLRHGFSHYSLTITPLLCRARPQSLRAEEPGIAWYALEEAIGSSIPAPVRTLLQLARDQRV
jgi:A/G-specific adenine glycosylase